MSPITFAGDRVRIEENHGRQIVSVATANGQRTPASTCTTSYPLDLIEHVLRVRGPAYLCDEIKRDEDPLSVQHCLRWDILSYVPKEAFAGRRVLDFGCGCGASSMVLARLFPDAEIVGIDLKPEFMELARHRARYYGLEGRVSFRLSSDPTTLPVGIGKFDYVVLSAVHEHLLPLERNTILALLWSHLNDGGVIFLDQTPYRWFPIEMHTTGLPLINYLPDRLTLYCSRRFSRRVPGDVSWPELLRRGVRGGTAREVLAILRHNGARPQLLAPSNLGVRDRIALWYELSSASRKPLTKRAMMWSFRALRAVSGVTVVPVLSLAIKKVA